MPKSATASPPLYRMRPLETGDVRTMAGYLAEALMAESSSRVRPSELEQALNLEIDSTPPSSPRFWIIEWLGSPVVIASGPNRDKRGEGFEYVLWLRPCASPLKEALVRLWVEKAIPSHPYSAATFCRAHGILPASMEANAR